MTMTMTKPLWGSDRDELDALGLRSMDDPHAAITLGQYQRARLTDRELVAIVIDRLGDDATRIYRMSNAELAVLANLERTST